MPDITLYHEDIGIIRDALLSHKMYLDRLVHKLDCESESCKDAQRELEMCRRLDATLLDRVAQNLHPKRKS